MLKYSILETSFFQYKFYISSLQAESGLYISRKMLNIDGAISWTISLEFHTGYTIPELQDRSNDMAKIMSKPHDYASCLQKFSTSKFFRVSYLFDNFDWEKIGFFV